MAMDESRSSPEVRKVVLVVSGLALTPDPALPAFRRGRGGDPELDIEHLRRARDIIDALGYAVVAADAERWDRIAEVWRRLEKDARDVPAAAREAPLPVKPKPSWAGRKKQPKHEQRPEQATVAEQSEPLREVAPPSGREPPAPFGMPRPLPSAPSSPPALAYGLAYGGASSPPAFSAAVAPAAAAPPPAVVMAPGGPSAIDATSAVSLSDLELGVRPLPFRSGGSPTLSPSLHDNPHDAVGQTGFMLSPIEDAPLPFDNPRPDGGQDAALPSHLLELTIEQYASFCAERAAYPEHIAAVRARYHVADEPQQIALDALWHRRFGTDAKLEPRFNQHVHQMHDWLARQRNR